MAPEVKPSIRELGSPARVRTVPAPVATIDRALKGHLGLCVGREHELGRMQEYFTVQQQAANDGATDVNDCLATVLTNAPGAGKTTMIEEFIMRQEQAGIHCIELTPEELHQEDWLLAALRKHVKVKQSTPQGKLMRIGNLLAEATLSSPLLATAAGTIVGLVKKDPIAGATAAAVVSLAQEIGKRRYMLRAALDEQPPATPEDAIELLDRVYDGKYIFTVDECHDWLDVKRSQLPNVKRNIRLITDPGQRSSEQRQGGGAVLAGLGDATDALDTLRLTRARVFWLGELDSDAARDAIQHQIELAAKDGNQVERVAELAPAWSQQLADTIPHWPQHCAAAGHIARRTIELTDPSRPNDQIPDATEEERLDWVHTVTAERIIALYGERRGVFEGAYGKYTSHAVMTLATKTDDNMPVEALRETIRRASKVELRGSTYAERKDYVDQSLSTLKRSGLARPIGMEDVSLGEYRRDESDWRVGIPSIRRYILEGCTPADLRRAEKVAGKAMRETISEYMPDEDDADDDSGTD